MNKINPEFQKQTIESENYFLKKMYDDYNTIQDHHYIPAQAFLYFPLGDSDKEVQDDFKLILPSLGLKRLIYEGGINYTPQQNQTIQKFRNYLEQKQVTLIEGWSKAYLYKFLQSACYDYKKAHKQIEQHSEYKKKLRLMDFKALRKRVEPILKQGPFYFNGRDSKFRPIIVFNILKIHEMNLQEQVLFETLQYFFQFLYRNMFINGQIQNVIGIVDVGHTSPLDLIKAMKMTINFLQGNYKYKLHAVYIFRATSMFHMAYSVAKHLMKQDTIRKITMIKNEKKIQPLLEYCHPSQLEEKYGGTHPNIKDNQFWPPCEFSNQYLHPKVKVKMITESEYRRLYKEGKLPGRKIYKPYVVEDSQLGSQLPVLNKRPPSMRIIQNKDINIHNREKNFIERVVQKIGCGRCFVYDRHKHVKQSHKAQKVFR